MAPHCWGARGGHEKVCSNIFLKMTIVIKITFVIMFSQFFCFSVLLYCCNREIFSGLFHLKGLAKFQSALAHFDVFFVFVEWNSLANYNKFALCKTDVLHQICILSVELLTYEVFSELLCGHWFPFTTEIVFVMIQFGFWGLKTHEQHFTLRMMTDVSITTLRACKLPLSGGFPLFCSHFLDFFPYRQKRRKCIVPRKAPDIVTIKHYRFILSKMSLTAWFWLLIASSPHKRMISSWWSPEHFFA